MKLKEIKNIINILVERGYGDKELCVKLSQPSVGYTAQTPVIDYSQGMDFDRDKFILITKDKITSYDKDRDQVLDPFEYSYKYIEDKVKTVLLCPKCENTIRKKDKYCSQCGQRVGE